MALSLTKTQLIELLPQCITITSEVGRVSGPGYREGTAAVKQVWKALEKQGIDIERGRE